MTYLQLAAHLFLLLFWTRFWVRPEQEFYFNPFLSGTTRLIDGIIGFLRPALMLPDRLMALVLLVLFWAFQAVFFVRFGKAWHIAFGMVYFAPPEEALSWGTQLACSGLRSAQFLLQVWTLSFLVRLISPPTRTTRAQEVLAFLTSPFSRIPLLAQPLVLMALHVGLVLAVLRTAALPSVVDIVQGETTGIQHVLAGGSALGQLYHTGLLALMSFVSGLEALLYALVVFLFAGLATMLFGAKGPAIICRESADLLMGRFARNASSASGGIDFTPLFFIIIVNLISHYLQTGLGRLVLLPLPL